MFIFSGILANAQMKLGGNPTVVHPDALLELESNEKGLVMPRIQLSSDTSSNPLSAHVVGMMIYNLDSAGIGINKPYLALLK